MTKYTDKSFSVPCSSGGVSDEELARRWEETFGKKKKPAAKDEPAPDEAEGDGDGDDDEGKSDYEPPAASAGAKKRKA
jgi:hypothetical protein